MSLRGAGVAVGHSSYRRHSRGTPTWDAATPPSRSGGGRAGPLFKAILLLWILNLFGPEWLLASRGFAPALKIPLLIYAALVAVIPLQLLSSPSFARRWQWHAPFLVFIILGWVAVPFAENPLVAYEGVKEMSLFWILIVSTAAIVDVPKRAELFLLLYGLQYLWWGVWGARTGLVPWHSVWSNYDGYGAMMVGGVGICYFFYLASEEKWFSRGMLLALGLCAIGIVASFARGAFLGAAGLLGVIWLRSPHKGRTFLYGTLVVLVMVGAAYVMHPGQFWAEIQSAFTEGTSEGTGEDRWILWGAALEVFAQHPFFGVGPDNFGPYAARFFQPGDIEGVYGANPGRLYDRSLHSMWVQFLCERGAVGMFVWLWILRDFWRRNAELRREKVVEAWHRWGGQLDLSSVALGLEASMVALLVTAAFYSLISTPWLYTLLAANLMVHSLAVRNNPFLQARSAPAGTPRPRRAQTIEAARRRS